MNTLLFMLLITIIETTVSSSSRPQCPNPKDLSPCTCDLEGISCNWAIDGEDLRRALSIYDGSSVYRGFWMVETQVKEIQNGTFLHNVFRNLYLPNNQIESIQANAFHGLEKSAKVLDMQNNKLSLIPIEAIQKLESLLELVLAKNQIESVPEKAFASFPTLYEIRLEGNRISQIGNMAFDINTLQTLNLANNRLKVIGDQAFALSKPNPDSVRLILDLSDNEIEKISLNALDGREDALGSVNIKNNGILSFEKAMFGQILNIINISFGVELDLSGNMIICDDSMEWVRKYPEKKLQNIHGIVCLSNGDIVDI